MSEESVKALPRSRFRRTLRADVVVDSRKLRWFRANADVDIPAAQPTINALAPIDHLTL